MRIAYKFPSRSRPDKAKACIANIRNMSASEDFDIYLTVDEDDPCLSEYLEINGVYTQISQAKSKVEAINWGLDKLNPFDILVCMSDDMEFTKKGFDNTIRGAFLSLGDAQPNLDLFLHFPDGNRRDLATMSIMGVDYFKRDNYIYHPSYKSLYCDNEAQEVSVLRKCYKFVDQDILSHNHPAYGKTYMDRLYIINESLNNEDRINYERRKAINFGIDTND